MAQIPEVNILIVDDREENIISLQSIIEGKNRKIYRAHSGNEALKLTLSVNFDLILCDVQMPEMDGFEVLELLRLDPGKRNIPFIFITAINKDEQYVKKGYHEGAVDYLFKPLNVEITQSKVDVFVELAIQKKQLISKNIELQALHEQKNQFIGMLAHDLRNPIGALQHHCSFLLEDYSDTLTDDQIKIIRSMKESSSYMLNLVNDLLDISHIESGNMTLNQEDTDLQTLVDDIISINNLFAREKDITIKLDCRESLPVVSLDGQKIRQVLNNLISNAVKFSFPKTNIELKVWLDEANINMEITDQGQGIPESEINNLFKPFQSTSVKSTSGEKSTGLGLLICAKIIECHGGKISVEATVGKGSKFSFYIPLKRPALSSSGEKDKGRPDIRPQVIIVADDNSINQLFLRRILETMGHTVILASNGQEVVEIVKEKEVDIIFMDVEMPEMDGVEATRLIRNELKKTDIRIIGCSGHSREEELTKCTDAGMQFCIRKPVTKDNLLKALEPVKT
jgi:signal transduction histidine kinase